MSKLIKEMEEASKGTGFYCKKCDKELKEDEVNKVFPSGLCEKCRDKCDFGEDLDTKKMNEGRKKGSKDLRSRRSRADKGKVRKKSKKFSWFNVPKPSSKPPKYKAFRSKIGKI